MKRRLCMSIAQDETFLIERVAPKVVNANLNLAVKSHLSFC